MVKYPKNDKLSLRRCLFYTILRVAFREARIRNLVESSEIFCATEEIASLSLIVRVTITIISAERRMSAVLAEK